MNRFSLLYNNIMELVKVKSSTDKYAKLFKWKRKLENCFEKQCAENNNDNIIKEYTAQ